ncbi:MAG: hypothetical protein H7210_12455 [Pyrinomonadaceae bacterium]|nr:hypothetical protein [Phycisphaerales bacterium]
MSATSTSSTVTDPAAPPVMESLLTPETTPDLGLHAARQVTKPRAQEQAAAMYKRFMQSPDMKWPRRISGLAAALGVVLLGIWTVIQLTPHPQPDFLNDDLGEVLQFTLLTDDFNRLPLDERMKLLKELVQRLKTMSADDAPVMAGFAAGLKAKMKQQVERNVKKLAADMIDGYAKDYASIEPERADEFLDDAIVGFTHLMEDIAGEKSPLPEKDSERLAVIKNQAKKDQERMREDTSKLSAARASRFFEFIHKDEGSIANPQQRGRSVKFMRDMTRHMRDQDVSTGKPKNGPG